MFTREGSSCHNNSRLTSDMQQADARFITNALLFFRATDSFRSGTETSKRNQVRFTSLSFHKFNASLTKAPSDFLMFSCSLSPATIVWPWSFCYVSVFSLSRSARGSSTVIFDRLALDVDVKTDGSHLALGYSFNSFSHCSWSK